MPSIAGVATQPFTVKHVASRSLQNGPGDAAVSRLCGLARAQSV
jgi:hypothetical protein